MGVRRGSWVRWWGAAGALALVGSCDGGRDVADVCLDADGDGYGARCEAGPDCDDRNASRNVDCDAVPPPDCAADPQAVGCACARGTTFTCFEGPADAIGVGPCRAGVATCAFGGFWGPCLGEVPPATELCNGSDDDCDGFVDDGVRSPCGGCDTSCLGELWGAATENPFEPAQPLEVDGRGVLTLARDPVAAEETVWVPSSDDALVSKIDAATAQVVATYPSGGASPSRVAVDWEGDAWVTNRAFDGTSTVTEIAGEPSRCVERNGVAGLQTSTGRTPLAPGEDECVLRTIEVGGPGAIARALAIDGSVGLEGDRSGNVWVGLYAERAVVELDATSGQVVDRVETPGLQPYTATFDPWGELWVASRDGIVARIDRRRRPRVAQIVAVPRPCFLVYGVASDAQGRLFFSGFSCDAVHRYDPATGAWAVRPVEQSARGLAVAGDDLWVAHTAGYLTQMRASDLSVVRVIDLMTGGRRPLESIGVGVDGLGFVWVVSAGGGDAGAGLATRVDPSAGAVVAHVSVGQGPHLQGDLTGARRRGAFAPEGRIRRVFEGCPSGDPTEWVRLHLDLDAGAAGRVTPRVRHAASREALDAAPFVDLPALPDAASPLALPALPEGGVLEVELVLETAARDGAPRVRTVGVEWRCGVLG